MFWNLIFGIIAGALTPLAEPPLRRMIEANVPEEFHPGPHAYDALALVLLLLAAAVLVWLLGVDSRAFTLLIGALIGLFGKPLYAGAMRINTRAANPGRGTPYTPPDATPDEPSDSEEDTRP